MDQSNIMVSTIAANTLLNTIAKSLEITHEDKVKISGKTLKTKLVHQSLGPRDGIHDKSLVDNPATRTDCKVISMDNKNVYNPNQKVSTCLSQPSLYARSGTRLRDFLHRIHVLASSACGHDTTDLLHIIASIEINRVRVSSIPEHDTTEVVMSLVLIQ